LPQRPAPPAREFTLKSLSFHGRIAGRTISGAVTDTAAGTPSGRFTFTRVDPMVALVP
jgi:hypothetical protein